MKNRAFYMTGINRMEMREIPMPAPGPKQVIIRMEYVGICGSDVHYLEYGRIGGFVVDGDFILGHECAGSVAQLGSDVINLKVGDRVALEPGIPCGQCFYCKTGKYNLCPDVEFLATPPYHGCLSDYIAYPANMCFKLPEGMSTREGALVEPLAVGMHAANQGCVSVGDTVLVLGSGCIGLVTMLACKAHGAGKVVIADVIPKRLEYARKMGAYAAIDARETDVAGYAGKLNGGVGPDVVIETAGNETTYQQTAYAVRRGGRIVLVGMPGKDIIPYDFSQIMAKEASINTVFRYRNIYPSAIEAIASGAINVNQIVTDEFDFTETDKAFEYVIRSKANVVKAVIKMV
jgi:L-iditol 2-dehydrogenase